MSNTLNACAVISLDCLLNCSAYGAYIEVGIVVLVDVTLLLPAQFLCAANTLSTNCFVICSILAVGLKLIVHIVVGI